jgi:hypothetical protein
VLTAALHIPETPKSSKNTLRPQNIPVIPRSAKSRDPGVKIVFQSEGQAFVER